MPKFFDHDHNTLMEEEVRKILPNGKRIGDVNIFMSDNLGRIKYKIDNLLYPQEEKDTGKTAESRTKINAEIDAWLTPMLPANKPVIFFLTGR